MRPIRGPQPGNQPRQGNNGQRRDHGNGQRRDPGQGRGPSQGRRQEQRAPITPMDKDLLAVREQQLEYHRKQIAEEQRAAAAPANERGTEQPKEKKGVPALFGWVGRKVA